MQKLTSAEHLSVGNNFLSQMTNTHYGSQRIFLFSLNYKLDILWAEIRGGTDSWQTRRIFTQPLLSLSFPHGANSDHFILSKKDLSKHSDIYFHLLQLCLCVFGFKEVVRKRSKLVSPFHRKTFSETFLERFLAVEKARSRLYFALIGTPTQASSWPHIKNRKNNQFN